MLGAVGIVCAQEHPYGDNPPRVNPDYCIGFRITYPAESNKTYHFGEMAHVAWEVDHDLPKPPDVITRIRILNKDQQNTQTIGENITIHTYDNKGVATFPILVHDSVDLQHYRIMVNYPGNAVHCVFESLPFIVEHRTVERYTSLDTPAPPFAVANAVPIDAHAAAHHHSTNRIRGYKRHHI
ncbi:hypothetical protein BDB00DRAFT_876612 [Zychaea mexicana]|uniref:uncharacterized protein n=1 Tax=Zychaea mexicana TaxID=64656 RepID=UPI0022FF2883|nr:uncharacterized protein BDB00DRAFT_876612 [Zychaea mexicana]KAI9489249.1 hypothetical protein BDB00DRAFT_876612 [Zychaea mexicana]